MNLDPEILEATFLNNGDNLKQLCENKPVLLVFLRHFGCTFCRESLTDIAKIRQEIVGLNIEIVIVHMANEEVATDFFSKYKMQGVVNISDPDLSLYEYFGLAKGSFGQLYGLKVWLRGLKAGLIDGHGGPVLNKSWGDYNQMPGLFIINKNEIKSSFVHNSAADRPNYLKFVKEFINRKK